MEQSLIAAVSGIQADQTYLDVVGNNVANANTTAYKSQDAVFTDLLAEQISGATAPLPNGQGAGVNPMAIGSGVRIGAVTSDQAQGAALPTNQPTDVAIQGQGFLVAVQNGQTVFTRAGHLTLDANGDLATPTGGLVQGWMANAQGTINANSPTGPVSVPTGVTMQAQPTTTMSLNGNLPLWTGSGVPPQPVTATQNAYDALGTVVPVTFTFTPVSGTADTWTLQGTVPTPTGGTTDLWSTPPTVTFDSSTGQIKSISGLTANADGSFTLPVGTMPSGYSFPTSDTWNVNFPAPNQTDSVTQYAGQQSLGVSGMNGSPSGSLAGFSIGSDGVITGSFTNGKTMSIGQIALATFANPSGLSDQGNLNYVATSNSGQPSIGAPGSAGRGTLVGGSLEASNVDLATQLTDLIVAQEAYQANTKVVSTTATNLNALTQMA